MKHSEAKKIKVGDEVYQAFVNPCEGVLSRIRKRKVAEITYTVDANKKRISFRLGRDRNKYFDFKDVDFDYNQAVKRICAEYDSRIKFYEKKKRDLIESEPF